LSIIKKITLISNNKMHPLIYIFLFISLLINNIYAQSKNTNNLTNSVLNIEKYTLSIPDEFLEKTMGFNTGMGSSITFKKQISNNHIQLYALCDRGPNYTIAAPKDQSSTIIFPAPKFSPFIGVIDIVREKSAKLSEIISLKIDNQLISGLCTPSAQYKSESLPTPTNLNFEYLPPDIRGVDPESLDFDKENNFWIGDEYGPRIFKANSNGDIIDIYSPEDILPPILKNGPLNRGFEALAVAPNGKIYTVMESILDFNGKTKNTANFMRMIEIDPITYQTRMFAYPFDQNVYKNNLAVKIGDLAAIDDTHFLIIEQGMTTSGMRNRVYIIDITNATDITNFDLPQERISNESIEEPYCIEKTLLIDPRQHDWPHEKLEGIAIIDEKTLAFTNDNDFGFSLEINNVSTQDVVGYTVDNTTQKLLRYGEETNDKIEVILDTNAETSIWLVNFEKPFFSESQSDDSEKNETTNFDFPLEELQPDMLQMNSSPVNKEYGNTNHIGRVAHLDAQGL